MPSPHVWRRRTYRPSSSRPAAPPSNSWCGGFATPSRRKSGNRNRWRVTVAATRRRSGGGRRAGRGGRGDRLSFSVLVTNSTPLNQSLAQHPDYLFETAPEAGFINPDNLVIRVSHLKCAAFELPFGRDEAFGPGSDELLDLLAGEGILHEVNGRYHWTAEVYPAEEVSLRTAAVA